MGQTDEFKGTGVWSGVKFSREKPEEAGAKGSEQAKAEDAAAEAPEPKQKA